MANRLHQLLATWQQERDSLQWVLATIIETDGSSYRKAGAMMMISSVGQYYGLLSGGCLESDIMRQARQCWDTGRNRIIQYDMREEEDLAWQLGIGCGGMVKILLQPVTAENGYLSLDTLYQQIEQNQAVIYRQLIAESIPQNQLQPVDNKPDINSQKPFIEKDEQGNAYFVSHILPPPHIAVFGGGVDAVPVVAMAAQLGWRVTLFDPRTSYARKTQFAGAYQIIKSPLNELAANKESPLQDVDAVIIMMHNVGMDAQALTLANASEARYIGLLGPTHRTDRVLDSGSMQREDITAVFANPIGLALGGELPESIAISILSELHAFLEGGRGHSISGVLAGG